MAQAAKKTDETFESQVKSYWKSRDKTSTQGLVLIDACIRRFAAHGDWDALSRFYVGALSVGQGPAIKRIIRAAFGNCVKFSLDSKHDTGGKFTKVNWPDVVFPLHESNSYNAVAKAIEEKKGWDHKTFQKALAEVVPTAPKPARAVTPESKEKVVKHLAKYVGNLKSDGFNVGEILAMLDKQLKAEAVTKASK